MNSDLWPANRVSVVLLPKTDLAHQLLDLSETWMHAWLLLPAIWVTAENIDATQPGPPRVTGIVIGKNGRREVDLFTELGRQHFESIRLVAVQDPHGIDGAHQSTLDSMKLVTQYVDASRPLGDESRNVGSELLTFNLLFNATEANLGDPNLLVTQQWTANLLVSPEDRPAPNFADQFTRIDESERMCGFVLSNLATAAGLWSGNPHSVYDLTSKPERGVGNAVILMRTFVRGIMSNGVSLRVAARALSTAALHESPLQDFTLAQQVGASTGLKLLTPDQLEAAIDTAVAASSEVQNQRLKYKPIPVPTVVENVKIGLWRTVKDFFKFVFDRLRAVPHNVWSSIKNRISRRATKTFYGEDSGIEIDINIDLKKSRLDAISMQQFLEIIATQEHLNTALASPMMKFMKAPEPRLWSDLRKIAFRLLDGSPAPEEVADMLPIEPGRNVLVVPDTHDVFPDINEQWEDILEDLQLDEDIMSELQHSLEEDLDLDLKQRSSWLDVSTANTVLDHIDRMVATSTENLQGLQTRKHIVEVEIAHARERKAELVALINGGQASSNQESFENFIERSRAILDRGVQAAQEESIEVAPAPRGFLSKILGIFRRGRSKS